MLFRSDAELYQLIVEIRSDRFGVLTRYALALLLLTGQRSSEVRGIRKAEVKPGVWIIPSTRTKNGKEQRVELGGKTTKTLLSLLFKEYGSVPFDGMERQVVARSMSRMGFTPKVTPHDLRRTMATRMADLGVAPHIIEKCLNHTLGGVMAVYNRAEYVAEKRAAWRLWERHLLRVRKKAPEVGG